MFAPAIRIILALACIAPWPGAVVAQGTAAYAAVNTHLRAGPAPDFPVVAVLPAGFQLWVLGCLAEAPWCDAVSGGNRGWVDAHSIGYLWQGTRVPLLEYSAGAGISAIGVSGFVLNDYWYEHYRSRPWFGDRERWARRPHFHPAPHRPGPATPETRPSHSHRAQEAAPIGPRVQPRPPGSGPLPALMPGVAPHSPRHAAPGATPRGQGRDGEEREPGEWRRHGREGGQYP